MRIRYHWGLKLLIFVHSLPQNKGECKEIELCLQKFQKGHLANSYPKEMADYVMKS